MSNKRKLVLTRLSYNMWSVDVIDNDLSSVETVSYDVPKKKWICSCGKLAHQGLLECEHVKFVKEEVGL